MKTRYFTKFCGITNIKDALNAEKIGCNAMGFVFVRKSKRFIDADSCQNIIDAINPNTLIVGLFADNSTDEIKEILNKCSVHVLQFHGSETVDFCSQWNRPYWKAIPMADEINPIEYSKQYPNAQGYLIDNYGINKSGGSGSGFDWKLLPDDIDNKWILAGGLNPDNIKLAVTETNMKCFDVSSGIEKRPGVKSKKKMIKFLKNLNLT